MKAHYSISVYNRFGEIVDFISDFVSLKIIDIRNGIGSWSITSQTKAPCPFQKGYGIVVFRNDSYYFSGYMDKVEAVWNKESQSWTWTVSGESNVGLLRWRVVFPPTERTTPGNNLRFKSKYRKFGNSLSDTVEGAVYDLVNENLAYNEDSFGYARGIPIVRDCYIWASNRTEFDSEVSYRFDNLYDVVLELLNLCGCTILTEWDAQRKKIRFVVRDGDDLSDSIVFRESHDDMSSVKRIIQVPEFNFITIAYNGDNENAESVDMWKYFESRYVGESQEWGSRESFIAPADEEFEYGWQGYSLYLIAEQEAKKYHVADEGYEIEIATANEHIRYQTEYKLGDIVGVELLDGTTFSAKVEKVQTEVSYGEETVRTFIGVHDYGALNGIQTDVSKLSSDVIRLSKK